MNRVAAALRASRATVDVLSRALACVWVYGLWYECEKKQISSGVADIVGVAADADADAAFTVSLNLCNTQSGSCVYTRF